MDRVVDKLASSYKDIIDATLSVDGSQFSKEQKEVLLTRFLSIFTEKLRFNHMRYRV